MSVSSDTQNRFIRTHPAWFSWFRKPAVIMLSLAVLIAYALFLLPDKESALPVWFYSSISFFIMLILAYSGNILADREKPEILKMGVALMLIAVLCWLFHRYSGAQWHRLADFFFNWKKLEGNWWILWQGLGVTLFLSFDIGCWQCRGRFTARGPAHLEQPHHEFLFKDLRRCFSIDPDDRGDGYLLFCNAICGHITRLDSIDSVGIVAGLWRLCFRMLPGGNRIRAFRPTRGGAFVGPVALENHLQNHTAPGHSRGDPTVDEHTRSDVKGYRRGIGSGGAGIVEAGPRTVYQ